MAELAADGSNGTGCSGCGGCGRATRHGLRLSQDGSTNAVGSGGCDGRRNAEPPADTDEQARPGTRGITLADDGATTPCTANTVASLGRTRTAAAVRKRESATVNETTGFEIVDALVATIHVVVPRLPFVAVVE